MTTRDEALPLAYLPPLQLLQRGGIFGRWRGTGSSWIVFWKDLTVFWFGSLSVLVLDARCLLPQTLKEFFCFLWMDLLEIVGVKLDEESHSPWAETALGLGSLTDGTDKPKDATAQD